MYYASETQVTPLTEIRRERLLPAPGEVLVRAGNRVESTQVVARTGVPSDFRIVPVARLLGVPASHVERHLRVRLGDEVHQGHVIAKQKGLFGGSVKSPIDGMVTAAGGGHVLIEARPTPYELRAYVSGTVIDVIEGHGVVIQTVGGIVQGVWGAGGESIGVLKVTVRGPDGTLRARSIDPSCHGAILIGGARLSRDVLERAQEIEVRGIVTGGLSSDLLAVAEKLPLPIIVTEGIGEIPMSEPIFDLLTAYEGQEASLNGRVKSQWGAVRPEIIIPRPDETVPADQKDRGHKPYDGTPLKVGARVRIVRAPHVGAVGNVVGLPSHARRMETGAMAYCAEVEIGQGDVVCVPLVNLDVLR